MKTVLTLVCERCDYRMERSVANRALVRVMLAAMDLRFAGHECVKVQVPA